jgi:hypothetical protein
VLLIGLLERPGPHILGRHLADRKDRLRAHSVTARHGGELRDDCAARVDDAGDRGGAGVVLARHLDLLGDDRLPDKAPGASKRYFHQDVPKVCAPVLRHRPRPAELTARLVISLTTWSEL